VLIKKLLLIFFLNLFFSTIIFAHSGGLDSDGGHFEKQLGLYHCHSDYCDLKKISFKEKNYNRKNWRHWIDEDRDCQNTRAEILIIKSILPPKFRNNKKCSVFSGKWYDPYSGKYWFLASDLDIDHLVPLHWAYNHGGRDWTNKKKTIFANDIENLIAVEDGLNQEKGSKGPDNWLPPKKSFQCLYVKKFDKVVKKYKLNYGSKEEIFIKKFLKQCF